MISELPTNYKNFFDHVFGDYRYFYYNGLSEDLFTCLNESDRVKAEKMVLRSIRKFSVDERAIRAAGYLKIQEAIPVLEKRLTILGLFTSKKVRSALVWALLKIKQDKQQLDKLIKVASGKEKFDNLQQTDAIELISDFSEESAVINTLLQAFLAKDLLISASAYYALRKIFKNNREISDLFGLHGFAPPFYIRDSIVRHIELQMRN
ncbi:MAG: hypothetical protein IT314_04470 [Anaerolineales bacterium]|nr:hypothetical protein [Anaerolineales bacterium]